MKSIRIKSLGQTLALMGIAFLMINCTNTAKNEEHSEVVKYPSDVIPFMDQWNILCGDGTTFDNLVKAEHKDFFYATNDGKMDWVVYKSPNSGVTSKTSHNTRTELGQTNKWKTEAGGKLTGTLKVMHVSTSGDARVAASYSVVVGQIHGNGGHANEPLKIFYKKFPGQSKGSVFWNYEINTEGSNDKRWDYSTAVWGNDFSVVGTTPNSYPAEPEDGIELEEEFSYEVNVYKGMMYLTFSSEGHETKTFTKNLTKSDFVKYSDIPQQILKLYAAIGRDGTEQAKGYANEIQNFKQGAYNQSNGDSPENNIVWSTGSDIYGGDIAKQYANGSYTEGWFKEGTVGAGTPPSKK